jgi:di/tricarboxylate transporter
MTFEAWFLIGIIFLLIYLFLSEKLPMDLSALLMLGVVIICGFITPKEAFSGFASPTVIIMICSFFITGAIRRTGIADIAGGALYKIAGNNEMNNTLCVVVMGIIVSSFMNNLSATALLLPPVVGLSKRSGVPTSKLLIPLTFGIVLGGTTTLIGCTANLLASDMLTRLGERPFGFLEFTPFGSVLCIVGAIFLVIWGRKFLPARGSAPSSLEERDLLSVYRLHERLLTLEVPKTSPLIGRSLIDLQLTKRLGASIDAIVRGKTVLNQPSKQEVIKASDTLVVRGRPYDFEAIARLKGISVKNADIYELANFLTSNIFIYAVIEVQGAFDQIKSTDALMNGVFGGVAPVFVERAEVRISALKDDIPLLLGDRIHCVGMNEAVSDLAKETAWEVLRTSIDIQGEIGDLLLSMSVGERSPLLGMTFKESDFDDVMPLKVLGIVRGETTFAKGCFEIPVIQGDEILIIAEKTELEPLFEFSSLERGDQPDPSDLYEKQSEMAEAVLSPRSTLVGKTLEELRFREVYGCRVVAIWRDGNPIRVSIGRTPLRFGDALLLQGESESFKTVKNSSDLILVSSNNNNSIQPFRRREGIVALCGLAIFILFSVLRVVPVEVAAFIGAMVAVLGRAITMEEAYHEVEWKIIAIIAGLLPIGTAVEHSGLLSFIAERLVMFGGMYGPVMVMALLCILSSFISQMLDNTLAIVLLVPLSVTAARGFHLNPHAFAMAVTLASSIVFMFPFSHRANLFIMGAGGYVAKDYFKIGTMLSIITLIGIILLTPVVYGFHIH